MRHVILNCIEWNRRALDHALHERHNPQHTKAIAACRDAQRHANNISRLEAQLEGDVQ